MHKIVDGTAPKYINEVFKLREESSYNLRRTSQFTILRVCSVYHGKESSYFGGPKI